MKVKLSHTQIIAIGFMILTRLSYDKAIRQNYDNPQLYAVQNWVIRVQGNLLTCAVDSFLDNYDTIMAGTHKKELLADTPGTLILDVLGDVAYRYAFMSEAILKHEVAADAIFDFLLGRLVHALRYYDTDDWKTKATAVDTKMIRALTAALNSISVDPAYSQVQVVILTITLLAIFTLRLTRLN